MLHENYYYVCVVLETLKYLIDKCIQLITIISNEISLKTNLNNIYL